MTNPQTACLGPCLEQKVTREADVPDGLGTCDTAPQPAQRRPQTGVPASQTKGCPGAGAWWPGAQDGVFLGAHRRGSGRAGLQGRGLGGTLPAGTWGRQPRVTLVEKATDTETRSLERISRSHEALSLVLKIRGSQRRRRVAARFECSPCVPARACHVGRPHLPRHSHPLSPPLHQATVGPQPPSCRAQRLQRRVRGGYGHVCE